MGEKGLSRFWQAAAAAVALLILYLAWKFIVPEVLAVFTHLVVLLVPFLAAVVLAVMLEPLVRFFNLRARLSRPLSVTAAMFVLVAGAGLLLTLLFFRLAVELSDLSVSLPRYLGPVQDYLGGLVERGRLFYVQLPPVVAERAQQSLGFFTGWLTGAASSAANFLIRLASAVPGALMVLVVTVLATYFISRDRDEIVRFWLRTVPPPWGERTVSAGREVLSAFLGYVRAQLFLISLTTLISIVGLRVIGAKYALTVGLLVGFFDLIPVLGPATVYLPWAAWALISGSFGFGLKILILYAVVWAVRQMLEARVVAANLGLHPLAVLVAMYAGLKSVGVAGLVLGPVLLIAALAAIKAYLAAKKQV